MKINKLGYYDDYLLDLIRKYEYYIFRNQRKYLAIFYLISFEFYKCVFYENILRDVLNIEYYLLLNI